MAWRLRAVQNESAVVAPAFPLGRSRAMQNTVDESPRPPTMGLSRLHRSAKNNYAGSSVTADNERLGDNSNAG